jgi:hypothetical protein
MRFRVQYFRVPQLALTSELLNVVGKLQAIKPYQL